MAKKSRTKRSSSSAPEVVVAIGASAGGVDAIRRFFANVKSTTKIAYIVIQHIDESAGTLETEALSQLTELPVTTIKKGTRLSGGKVYHAPAHHRVGLKAGAFTSEKASSRGDQFTIIDSLFTSLARNQNQRAAGVILSGRGSDGTRGLKTIADAGGLAIAQNPESAEFPAMPQNAISTGSVDHILQPEDMGARIQSYADSLSKLLKDKNLAAIQEQITSALGEICEILQKATRHDFKHYKSSTLVRRIQRRMQVHQQTKVEAYVEKLQSDPKEIDTLFKELLINVTSFFRDPEAFKALREEVLAPALRNRKPDQKYRIWVAGCSTGEEVYTLAMIVKEILAKVAQPPEVQIIATDIDEAALNFARKGSYPSTIVEHVSPARLKKFFTRKNSRYVINRELREIVLFSSHNLIGDPPFSQLDLISCRNVLIYLGSHLQKKLIPVFHYALRAGGYLFLGTSESLTGHRELFKTVSAKHRIAQRKLTSVRPPGVANIVNSPHALQAIEQTRNHDTDLQQVGQRILLDEFAPKYAIVNDECQVVSVSGGLSQYLELNEGVFQNNLLRLVKSSLRVGLRGAFNEARKRKRKVTYQDASLKMGNELARIGITVQPMPKLGDDSELYYVVFQYFGSLQHEEKKRITRRSAETDSAVVDQLERELTTLREDLDRTIQDLEASNEELKSSNEELLSMNEELQSANEELEASKEDVQHANEALQRSNSDLENLLASTEIATLFLDEELRIQSYTPQLENVYNITQVDIGRPIGHLTNLAKSMPSIPRLTELDEADGPIESDVVMEDGRVLLRRVSPYKTAEGNHAGIVVTFIDITHLRQAENKIRENQNRLSMMIRTSPSFMCLLRGPEFIFEQANERYLELIGRREIIGKSVRDVLPEAVAREFIERLNQVRYTGEPAIGTEVPFKLERHDGQLGKRYIDYVYQVAESSGDQIDRIFVQGNDVTAKVLAKAAIENERENFRNLFKQTPEMVCIMRGPNHVFEFVNDAHVRVLGFDATGLAVRDAQPESVEVHGLLDEVYRTGVTAELHEIPVTVTDRLRYFNLTYAARRDEDGNISGVMILGTEITDQILSRRQLEDSQARFRLLAESLPTLIWTALPDGTVDYYNGRWYDYTGTTWDHLSTMGWQSVVHPDDVEQVSALWNLSVETGKPLEHQFRIRHATSGEYRWHIVRGVAHRNQAGKIVQWFGSNMEIHDQKLAAKRIAESEERLNLALISADVGFWDFDPKTGRITISDTLMKDWGIDETVFDSKLETILMSVHIDDRQRVAAEIERSLRDQLPYEVEYRVLRPSGELIWIYAKGRYYLDEDGRADRLSGITINITKEKAATEELLRLKEEAEKANRTKTVFLANMSHEIRTPLAAILGYADLLKGRTLDGDHDAATQLDRLSRNAAHLGRLIDEILDLSKIEAERFEIEHIEFDLQLAIDDALSAVAHLAQQKGLELRRNFKNPLPPVIQSDPTRLKQILTNITGNAVKFTESGHIDIEFEHLIEQGKHKLQVRVKDTGIGLSPEQQSRLFEPFTQADASVTRKYGGTGLGLVLSRRLARLLGGDLVLESSALGQGSSFLLAVEFTPASDTRATRIPKASSTISQSPQDKKALDGKTILVVDDSVDNQTIIRLFIHAVGGKVEIANNGLEAIERMRERQYDAVLMDIQMPVMDGYQALKAANESGYRGQVVALTAHALKEEKDRCLAVGFTDYMSKPIDRGRLIQRLIELCC